MDKRGQFFEPEIWAIIILTGFLAGVLVYAIFYSTPTWSKNTITDQNTTKEDCEAYIRGVLPVAIVNMSGCPEVLFADDTSRVAYYSWCEKDGKNSRYSIWIPNANPKKIIPLTLYYDVNNSKTRKINTTIA